MSAPPNDGVARRTGPRTLAEKLSLLRETRLLRPANDHEHAEDIRRAGGDKTIERRLRPMTYKEIAEKLGNITDTHVGYLLTGQRDNPHLDLLRRWAKLCNVTVAYLADDDLDLDDQVEQELARDRVRADTSLRTMADRFNGLISAIRPSTDGSEYTDDQLANIAGCSPYLIRGLRAGSSADISLGSLQKLAETFGVTVGYLIDGAGGDQIDQRLDLWRQFGEDGDVQLALDMLRLKDGDHLRAMSQMLAAFLRIEALPAEDTVSAEKVEE